MVFTDPLLLCSATVILRIPFNEGKELVELITQDSTQLAEVFSNLEYCQLSRRQSLRRTDRVLNFRPVYRVRYSARSLHSRFRASACRGIWSEFNQATRKVGSKTEALEE